MTKLTVQDLADMVNDDEWLGWGYLGERNSMINGNVTQRKLAERTDRAVVQFANVHGWTRDELFTWANSKPGRWLGDVVFGGHGSFTSRWAEALRSNLLQKVED